VLQGGPRLPTALASADRDEMPGGTCAVRCQSFDTDRGSGRAAQDVGITWATAPRRSQRTGLPPGRSIVPMRPVEPVIRILDMVLAPFPHALAGHRIA
jgi:hypothetical protein